MILEDDYHIPVLLEETIQGLNLKPDGTYVDCTMGGGGHFKRIIQHLHDQGCAIGIDRDPHAISRCRNRFADSSVQVIIEQVPFSQFDIVLNNHRITNVQGILLDLGVSSAQLDTVSRGFSYKEQTTLDMRMDPNQKITAQELLASTSKTELVQILAEYGEVRNPERMAQVLYKASKVKKIETTEDLKRCLEREYGAPLNFKMLSKLFQALRIAVNDELNELKNCLHKAIDYLSEGGRLVVLAYHSLEDRIVKNFFREKEIDCHCDAAKLHCQCVGVQQLRRITRKAIKASQKEISLNTRARSVRLRIAEKVS